MPTVVRQNRDPWYHSVVIPRSTTMNTNGIRAAIYLRVSRDDQTTDNQRLVLERVATHRGWLIVQTYEDQGISGAKGRDQRPAFDRMLKDAVRRRFDILLVWVIDRLGRSVLHVANALAELDAAGVRLYCDQQGIDSGTPIGRAMIQMASVFGEQERQILRSRVLAGLNRYHQQGGRQGERHQDASEGRQWGVGGRPPSGCGERYGAAGQKGDGRGVGGGGVMPVTPSKRSDPDRDRRGRGRTYDTAETGRQLPVRRR
jgi:DNA invertase Pin-like site-specific DNA recombinase